MEWTSGGEEEEGASVKSLLQSMSSMLMALTARVDGLDNSTGRRTVVFQEDPPASSVNPTSDASGAFRVLLLPQARRDESQPM